MGHTTPAVRPGPEAPTGTRSGRGGRGRIAELEVIEFQGAAAVAEYARVLRAVGRDLAQELMASAEELEAVLVRQHGHPLLLGIDTRLRARRVAARLRRGAEAAHGLAIEAVKFNTEFRTQFADVLQPQKRKRQQFDWSA